MPFWKERKWRFREIWWKIEDFFKKNISLILTIVGILAVTFPLPYLQSIYNLLDFFIRQNFPAEFYRTVIILGFIFIYTIFVLLRYARELSIEDASPNKQTFVWSLILTLFVISSLVIGLYFIQIVVGVGEVNFLLYPSHDNVSYPINTSERVKCDYSPELKDFGLLSGVEYTCSLPERYNLLSAEYRFTLADGSEQNLTDGLKFIPPLGTSHLGITFRVSDTLENATKLSASYRIRFRTVQEDNERKDKLHGYTATLLGFILVGIPTAVASLRRILSKN